MSQHGSCYLAKLIIVCFFGATWAECTFGIETSNPPLEISVGGSVNYGLVDGFFQTPAGGNPGSSTKNRPTLDELDIHDVVFFDSLASIRWRKIEIYVGYQSIGMSGDANLSDSLMTHGLSFPANDLIHSKINVDWLHAGFGWQFGLAGERLHFMPKVDLALVDLNYKLSDSNQAVSRAYRKGSFRLGLKADYRINQKTSAILDGDASLPISDMPQLASVTIGIEVNLGPDNWFVHPRLLVGGGAEWTFYEDSQPLSNHFHLRVAPFGTIGIGLSF